MSVYTVAGGKGGVGKSTTVASVGLSLRAAGASVALVDADLSMANLATILGVETDRGIHQVLAGDADLADVRVETATGMTLVPGDHGLRMVAEADPAKMRAVIDPLAETHDVVLVDTGAGLDHETLVTTGLADGTVVTTTPRREAIADVAKTVEFVEHAEADVLGAVVTRVRPETDPAAIAADLGVPLLGVIPEQSTVDTAPLTEGAAGAAYEQLTASLTAEGPRDDLEVAAPAAVEWRAAGDDGAAESASEAATAVADGGPTPDEEDPETGVLGTLRSLFT
jgi:septum site-determining protein MinD